MYRLPTTVKQYAKLKKGLRVARLQRLLSDIVLGLLLMIALLSSWLLIIMYI